jgi:hypothetical protein
MIGRSDENIAQKGARKQMTATQQESTATKQQRQRQREEGPQEAAFRRYVIDQINNHLDWERIATGTLVYIEDILELFEMNMLNGGIDEFLEAVDTKRGDIGASESADCGDDTPDDETPDTDSYHIEMRRPCGIHEQDIELSRDEYIALKAHLAALRGAKGHGKE